MTINEQVKILYDKIKANKAQYGLDRQAAKISALSSGELEKYEYLSCEDLGYKPSVVQKEKFVYCPLGRVFNKRVKKNIEGTNEQQLNLIRDQNEKQLDLIGKINTDETKKIGHYDAKNKTAVDLVNKWHTI